MRRARWLAKWQKAAGKPMLYHVHSRVVDRRFVLRTEEKEKFRTLMLTQENFTGCRTLSCCLIDNHFHIVLEVPPIAEGGLSDGELLKRLSAIYGEAFAAVSAFDGPSDWQETHAGKDFLIGERTGPDDPKHGGATGVPRHRKGFKGSWNGEDVMLPD